MRKTIYRVCPLCMGEKAIVMTSAGEWDTNAGPEYDFDEILSCGCDLSADECEQVLDGVEPEDFIEDDF